MNHRLPLRTRLLVGLIVGVLAALVQLSGWVRPLEELNVDARLRWRPVGRVSEQVRLVGR